MVCLLVSRVLTVRRSMRFGALSLHIYISTNVLSDQIWFIHQFIIIIIEENLLYYFVYYIVLYLNADYRVPLVRIMNISITHQHPARI